MLIQAHYVPIGFGLRTSPVIHQIAKAAGISDLSAKIRGSRNDMNTVKAVINLLHGGAAPVGAWWTFLLCCRTSNQDYKAIDPFFPCLLLENPILLPATGLGDLSGKGKLARRFKGSGMRTAQEVGLNLGRRAIEVR